MKKTFLAIALLSLIAVSLFANGQQESSAATADAATKWPEKPVTIVVPYGAGGDSDFNGRVLAKYLTKELGQTVVVENIKGSGGSIGAEDVANAKPDGYKVLQIHNALQISHASGITDVSLDSYEFVGVTAQNPGDVIAVSSKTGWKNISDIIEASKAKKLTVATNIGATTQVESFMLGEVANLTQVDVGAIADKVAALLGGQVDIIIGPYGNIKPYVESGDFTAVGMFMPERAKGFPEVPTLKEQGYDIEWETTFFYAFPKGTDKAIVDKFSKALEKIITTDKDYADEIMKAYYQTPVWMPGEEGKALLDKAEAIIAKYSLTALN